MKWNIALLSFIVLCGCQKDETSEKLNVYFDLEALLENQINRLKVLDPTVIKSVGLGGKSEESKAKIDTGKWKNEFAVFIESNINRSSLVGAFEEIRTGNSLLYQRKNPEEDGVKRFEIIYFKNSEIPREIRIERSTINSLYQSERMLSLEFVQHNDDAAISSYLIEGSQTIIFQEPTAYKVEAEFLYN